MWAFVDLKISAEKTLDVVRTVTAVHISSAQVTCLDDQYDDDDYQEAEPAPPHSVLDVYRQGATPGHFGSQGPSVLDRLIA